MRIFSDATSPTNAATVTSVKAYTSGGPLNPHPTCSVSSTPPSAGPRIFAVWKTFAPHVTAFTKSFSGTKCGTSALDAGPLKALAAPIKNSTE
jgi:hypothetical protein